ncbi:hypothetical protein OWV82_022673 [Melia azedarach]|uniref:Uncharacterized protein n=1 Tax=Melia azedarach TaxID=155640 RepID=A0ACC1WUN1_MELAZ|nr:hypothetical protein OWV82_022673 [Melia azedarach]
MNRIESVFYYAGLENMPSLITGQFHLLQDPGVQVLAMNEADLESGQRPGWNQLPISYFMLIVSDQIDNYC